MTSADRGSLALTKSQADCLMVLRNPGYSQGRVAVAAKLDLEKTAAALRRLEELGLARRNDSKLWSATGGGETCDFEIIPDLRKQRGRPPKPGVPLLLDLMDRPICGPTPQQPGPSGQRLLDLLDRPKNAGALSRESGFSRERVRQLLLRLHAQGRIAFADPDHPFWLVKRADDESLVLFRDDARVLSALPLERAADVAALTRATKLARGDIERIIEKLIDGGLIEALGGPNGAQAFRIAAAGLEHPQYVHAKRRLPPTPLPVRSDRVRTVLQTIADSEALRIRDVKYLTKIPQNSINALMQYLKRKQLVAKAGDEFDAPYFLTEQGRATLAEMTLRLAA
jgi:DNA-binding MarR family transcriptional regulator/predicted transcriptional regulator